MIYLFILTALLLVYEDLTKKEVDVRVVLFNLLSMLFTLPLSISSISICIFILCCIKNYKVEYVYILPVAYALFTTHSIILALIVFFASAVYYKKNIPMMPTILAAILPMILH